ncbi:MAG: efflux RND transporter periplasmic adaptor subunit [Chloroflexi bacterium]|jgi:HlyD family secretion protein|nr:efflux RND transporter periplasmic adaptor subunit [Chloroflexota bacterium]MBT3669301.1 efflux RND transporter periplasmic adaptor subunit [Chloroflexota bacterium]MBT4003265.1 efflux RND transporter periplasmic adaptor subunit [Chloroflexota bacterium]MBT4306008.1 efflux RND transporter periplasmic adaptor subunit [Chloroflexota bacterium]MBT4532652.1 efflux RND transporter periplasmic adaptor subunit [Chloroflexota bacterium]
MKKTIIIIVVVLVVVASIWGFLNYQSNQSSQALLDELQTVEAEKGSLVATVGATGTVRSNQSAVLTWKTSGIVGEIFSSIGQTANQGDLLAELLKTSLPQNVILAQSDLINAEKALENLGEGFDALALAQAIETVAGLEKSVLDATQHLYNVQAPPTQKDIDQAESTLVLAEDRLDRAQSDWDKWEDAGNVVLVATMQGNLAEAKTSYNNALYRYNSLIGGSMRVDVDKAKADVALYEAQLEDAKLDYDVLLAGPTEGDRVGAQARVDAAQSTLDMAFIEAPFTGTITSSEIKSGDLVSAGTPAFRIDDLSHLLVDVEISEVDINRIQEDQDVVLTFDAILATEYKGNVLEVSKVGNSNQGLVTFKVTIELIDKDDQVKPGMTSGVNIVVSQLENVLLVLNRAVRVEDGSRVVYILDEDEQGGIKTVKVELGVSSDMYSQVLDGELSEGDTVVLNPPTNFFDGASNGGPFGGPGGGF